MKLQDITLLFVFGLIFWIAGTMYFAHHGARILETTRWRYWANLLISSLGSLVICIAILRWRRISAVNWAPATLLLAVPGMLGEAVVLSHLARFMPKWQERSGGRYGALLFATYGLVLTVGVVVTLTVPR
jgi:Family of unknown function (DUF5367)